MIIAEESSQKPDMDTRKNLIQHYRPDAERLVPYISWLEKKHGGDVMNSYEGEGVQKTTFTFPVYDSALLGFVKVAKGTVFITRNYQYVYNRNRIRGVAQEKKSNPKSYAAGYGNFIRHFLEICTRRHDERHSVGGSSGERYLFGSVV